MKRAPRPVADTVEDLTFLADVGTGADEASRRLGFPTADAMQTWLVRNGHPDLWKTLMRLDPPGTHMSWSTRKKRRTRTNHHHDQEAC